MGQLGEFLRVAGRYRLTEVIGRGGMGTVWRAEDELLGRAVAVKVIAAPDALTDPGSPPETQVQTAGRARREARAAGRLNHPGAVTIHDIVEEDGRFHIIMELIQAPTLADLVRAEGHLPSARVAAIGAQVLDVLDFAHAEGIVHRDVKPSNVMVLPQDRVKLTDFGIARLLGDPQLTMSGTTLGSPLFMAPEQAAGTEVGPAADLWSLGATMYYAVEGRAPFDRPGAMAVLAAVLNQPPDPPELAGPLEPALIALLARAPQDRPRGAVLRRLLSLAALGDGTDSPAVALDPEATLDLNATREIDVPPSPVPETPGYGTPEEARRPSSVTDEDPPPAQHRVGRREATVVRGLVGALVVTVATSSFFLLQPDSGNPEPSGSDRTVVRQDPGAAGVQKPADELLPSAVSPLAPDAPADGLGLGSPGRTGLRQVAQADVGPRGQSLARFFDSASNPVGGYAVGVPLSFESVAVGPTTFVEQNDAVFRAGFEVRSYRSVDPWTRLRQDEKQFAQEHADDGYRRRQLTRRWTYRGQEATVWEFTWKLNGELTHAREVAFRVGTRTYTVLYRSADLWWLSGGSEAWPAGFEKSFFPAP